jgi:hypothetical protein
MTTIVKAQTVTVQTYRALEQRIQKNDLDALLARWDFGRQLNEEKATAKRGDWMARRVAISNALGISLAELSNRMQFAEQYATKDKVRLAYLRFGSWYAICASGLGDRGQASYVGSALPMNPALTSSPLGPPFVPNEGPAAEPPMPLTAREALDHVQQLRALARVDLLPTLSQAHLSPEAARFVARWLRETAEEYTRVATELEQRNPVIGKAAT